MRTRSVLYTTWFPVVEDDGRVVVSRVRAGLFYS